MNTSQSIGASQGNGTIQISGAALTGQAGMQVSPVHVREKESRLSYSMRPMKGVTTLAVLRRHYQLFANWKHFAATLILWPN
jgi:hypothetical protein